MSSDSGSVGASMMPVVSLKELAGIRSVQPIPLDIVSSSNRGNAVNVSLSSEAAQLLSRP